MLFPAKNVTVHSNPNITIAGEAIEIVKSFKILGVIFSDNLSWNEHIEYIHKKARKAVGTLSRYRTVFTSFVKLIIFHGLVQSYFQYCHLVWGTTTIQNINKLLTLQKKSLRVVANVSYFYHTDALFVRFNVVRITHLHHYRLLVSYKTAQKNKHSCFLQIANLNKNTSVYNTRRSEEWSVPTPRTNYGLTSLTFTLPSFLNKLNVETDFSHSLPFEALMLILSKL